MTKEHFDALVELSHKLGIEPRAHKIAGSAASSCGPPFSADGNSPPIASGAWPSRRARSCHGSKERWLPCCVLDHDRGRARLVRLALPAYGGSYSNVTTLRSFFSIAATRSSRRMISSTSTSAEPRAIASLTRVNSALRSCSR